MIIAERTVLAGVDWRTTSVSPFVQAAAVLWPVNLFDVLVADASEQELNILQEAVLSFMRMGLRDERDIGRRLHLESDLIAIARAELADLGYVDDTGLVTDLGNLAVEDRVSDTWTVRSAVQDAFTGRLLHVLLEHVREPSVEWREGTPVLVMKNTTKRLELLGPPRADAPVGPPSASEVAEALEASLRASGDDAEVTEAEFAVGETQVQVESLSEVGMAAWMPMVIYLPKPPDDTNNLCALGVDGRPGRQLHDLLTVAAGIDATAERILLQLDKAAREARLGPHREYLDRVRLSADQALEHRLGHHWRNDRSVWDTALDLRAGLFSAEEDPDRAASILASVAMDAGRLLEAIGQRMADSRPFPPAVAEQLKKNGTAMKKRRSVETPVIGPAVTDAGATWALDKLPGPLCQPEPQWEGRRPTGTYWNWARAVAAAHYDDAHPLRALLLTRPDWLTEMEPVVRQRNRVAHGGRGEIDPTAARDAGEAAFDLAAAALRILSREDD